MELPLLAGFAAGGALVPAGVLGLRRLARERRFRSEMCRVERSLAAAPATRLAREEAAYALHDRMDRLLRAGRLDRAHHEALDRRIRELSAPPRAARAA